jgi:hypothetical protein
VNTDADRTYLDAILYMYLFSISISLWSGHVWDDILSIIVWTNHKIHSRNAELYYDGTFYSYTFQICACEWHASDCIQVHDWKHVYAYAYYTSTHNKYCPFHNKFLPFILLLSMFMHVVIWIVPYNSHKLCTITDVNMKSSDFVIWQ